MKILGNILLNLLTGAIGAFVAIYLKEYFGFEFSSKLKKRELKTSIIKNTVQFFGISKKCAIDTNNIRLHQRKMALLVELKANPEDHSERIEKNIQKVFDFTESREPGVISLYLKLSDLEGAITADTYICRQYFENHQFVQLRKEITRIFSPEYVTSLTIREYDGLTNLHEISNFNKTRVQRIRGRTPEETGR